MIEYFLFYDQNLSDKIEKQVNFINYTEKKIYKIIQDYYDESIKYLQPLKQKYNFLSAKLAYEKLKKCLQYKQKIEFIDLTALQASLNKNSYELDEEEIKENA